MLPEIYITYTVYVSDVTIVMKFQNTYNHHDLPRDFYIHVYLLTKETIHTLI